MKPQRKDNKVIFLQNLGYGTNFTKKTLLLLMTEKTRRILVKVLEICNGHEKFIKAVTLLGYVTLRERVVSSTRAKD